MSIFTNANHRRHVERPPARHAPDRSRERRLRVRHELRGVLVERVDGLFGREDLIFIFLETGGLIGSEAGVSLPPEAERVSGSANCNVTLAAF